MSSACTGAYTAEMAAKLVLHTVGRSEKMPRCPKLKSTAAWDSHFDLGDAMFFQVCFFDTWAQLNAINKRY